jgi:hypothetical protein
MIQKTVLFVALAIFLTACGGKGAETNTTKTEDNTKQTTEKPTTTDKKGPTDEKEPTTKVVNLAPGAFPFEYPIVEQLQGEVGSKAFHINMTLIRKGLAEGKEKILTQFLLGELTAKGDKESTINTAPVSETVPNSGIVVIPKGQKVKVGDIVAGKWAVNLNRAIITDASNPKAPKATFIGLPWDLKIEGDDKKTPAGQYEFTLKENEFMVITKDYAPSSCCAVKKNGSYQLMKVFSSTADMVLGTIRIDFTAVKKADCVPFPLKTNFKVGEEIWAVSKFGTIEKGTVKAVNAKMGRYTVTFSPTREDVVSFGEVIKNLP